LPQRARRSVFGNNAANYNNERRNVSLVAGTVSTYGDTLRVMLRRHLPIKCIAMMLLACIFDQEGKRLLEIIKAMCKLSAYTMVTFLQY
jgi:hypothetical protein